MAGDVDVETLIMNLLAIKDEMEETIRELLIMLIKEHKDCSDPAQDPEIGLAEILSKPNAMSNISSLKFPANIAKIYDKSTTPATLKSSIDLKSLDITFMVDILKSVQGFPTCRRDAAKSKGKTKKSCMNPNHQKCCNACKHVCTICSKTSCSKGCPGKELNHPCSTCNETKSSCTKNSTICCSTCKLCVRCGSLKADKNQCPILRLDVGVHIAQLLRNLFSHLTREDCEQFINSLSTLEGFISCKGFGELKKHLLKAGKNILDYMNNPHCFTRTNPLSEEDRDEKLAKFKLALGKKETLLKFFSEVIVKSASELKDDKITLHLDTLLQRIIDELKSVKESIKESEKTIVDEVSKKAKSNEENVIQAKEEVLRKIDTLKIGDDEETKKRQQKEKYLQAVGSLKEIYKKWHSKIKRKPAIERGNGESPEIVARDDIIVDVQLKQLISEEDTGVLDNIFHVDDDYVVITGTSGIGKTTLINTLAYRWATGEIWSTENGEKKNFDFVFTLYCRQLNKYQNKSVTVAEVLKQEFNEVFQYISFEELMKNKHRILFILEGFDEISVYSEFKEMSAEQMSNVSDYAQLMFDFVNPISSVAPFNRLITGRPGTDSELARKFKDHAIKQLVLTGFNKHNQNSYIDKYFNDKPKLAETVKQKISQSPVYHVLSSRPFYCWIFCCLIQDELPNAPKTYSEIYANIILLLYRNQGKKYSHQTLCQFVKSTNVQQNLLQLGEIAFESLKKGNIVFTEADIGQSAPYLKYALQYSALVETINGDEFDVEKYQFTHLIIQEFLAAYYVFYHKLYALLTVAERRFLFSQPLLLLFLSGLIGSSSSNTQRNSLQLLASQRKTHVVFAEHEEIIQLFKLAAKYIQLRCELYYEMYFEYHKIIQNHPEFNSTLKLPPSSSLTSFDILRIKYFLTHIQQTSSPFPFTGLILNTTLLPLEIMKLIKPHLRLLLDLKITCHEGTMGSLAESLPFIERVSLPLKGVSLADWSIISHAFEKSNFEGRMKTEGLHLIGQVNFSTVPEVFYKILPLFECIYLDGINVNVSELHLMVSSFNQNMSLEIMFFGIHDFDTFAQFCSRIHMFRFFKTIVMILSIQCNHKKEIEKRKRCSENRGRTSKGISKNFFFDDPREVITCQKCHEMVKNKYEGYLLKRRKRFKFDYVSIPKVYNKIDDEKATFCWKFVLCKQKEIFNMFRNCDALLDSLGSICEIMV